MYSEDEGKKRMWMIHPEFLNENNSVILDKNVRVPIEGKAQMWILNEEFFEYHKERIKVGLPCFLVEGPNKVAVCEVVEIVRLKQ
jgi:hypothetical protein